MKKRIAILLICKRVLVLCLSFIVFQSIFAQINPVQISFEFGVGGGKFKPESTGQSTSNNIYFGGFYKHPISEKMLFKTGMYYENRSIHNNFSYFTFDSIVTGPITSPEYMKLISIHFLIGIEFRKNNRGLTFSLGPNMGFILTDSYIDNGAPLNNDVAAVINLSNFELGLVSQVEVFWDNFYGNLGFAVGFRNQLGLTSFIHANEGFSRKTNLFQINLSLRYSL